MPGDLQFPELTHMDNAKQRMRGEIQHWAAKIGAKPKRVQIQRMTTKWASCSTTGRICCSTELPDEAAQTGCAVASACFPPFCGAYEPFGRGGRPIQAGPTLGSR